MIMLLAEILFCLTACRMEESYKKFVIKNVSDRKNEDYYNSEKSDFARIKGVLIIPEIKEIKHGEYCIYISAYSEVKNEKITIKKISIKEDEELLLTYNLNENILIEEENQGIFEGWIEGGIFSDDTIKVVDGKTYILIVQVEVVTEKEGVTKDIEYEMNIKGYRSLVTPT